MQSSHATMTESASHASQPFFGPRPGRSKAFFAPKIQAKLSMGAPGDRFEREADSVADAVVQRKQARSCCTSAVPSVQAKCAKCEHDETLRRQPDAGSDTN